MAVVVVERLPKHDYVQDCVALTRDYGRESWETRPENAAIRTAVFSALDKLENESDIRQKILGRPVLVKPNLVLVYYYMGTINPISPETTDPRVFDAAVLWLAQRASNITIVESSGRGSPTRSSFRISGLDRIARHRGCDIIALEEQPVDRYILPQAKVQKEILVPRIFSSVVRGDAAYVSVPKLKTNLYTEVTLGFKNAMGVIPYNLRQRNHTGLIVQKLVDMLYLFKPDITLIDGVVGGEGECPAPVDPVDSRMIIAGDHAVETDRAATALMGFDPSSIKLMQTADALGFGEPDSVKVYGDTCPVKFRPADASLISERVRADFPQVKFLLGIDKVDHKLPKDREFVRAMERVCRGGCIATVRFGLGMLKAEGIEIKKPAAVVLGGGIEIDGERYWYDGDGKAYTRDDILRLPGKMAVIGSCGEILSGDADYYAPGCIPFPNSPHAILHALAGKPCRVLSLQNKQFFKLGGAMLKTRGVRRSLIKQGLPIDVPMQMADDIVPVRELSAEERKRVWVEWPLPRLTRKEQREALAFEDDSVAGSFLGNMHHHFVGNLVNKILALLTFLATLAPLLLGVVSVVLNRPVGWSAANWFIIYLGVELLHVLELPFALKRAKRRHTSLLKMAVKTLFIGFPAWTSPGESSGIEGKRQIT